MKGIKRLGILVGIFAMISGITRSILVIDLLGVNDSFVYSSFYIYLAIAICGGFMINHNLK